MDEAGETPRFVVLRSGKRNGIKLPSITKVTVPKPAQPVNPRWQGYLEQLETSWDKGLSFEDVKAELVEMFSNELKMGMEEHQNREDNQRPIIVRSRAKLPEPAIEKDNPFYEQKEPVNEPAAPLIQLDDTPLSKVEVLEPVKVEMESIVEKQDPVSDQVEKSETETAETETKNEIEPVESMKKIPIKANRKTTKGK